MYSPYSTAWHLTMQDAGVLHLRHNNHMQWYTFQEKWLENFLIEKGMLISK